MQMDQKIVTALYSGEQMFEGSNWTVAKTTLFLNGRSTWAVVIVYFKSDYKSEFLYVGVLKKSILVPTMPSTRINTIFSYCIFVMFEND